MIFSIRFCITGGTESNKPYIECFFGELDSKDSNMGLNTNKPIYYLQGGEDMNSVIARNEMTKQSIKKDSNNAKVSNNSNMDSLDCHEAKASRNDNKESISTAFLCPILEDNELKCPHNGIVKLKSNKGKSFKSKDILNKSIINHIAESYLSESKEVV